MLRGLGLLVRAVADRQLGRIFRLLRRVLWDAIRWSWFLILQLSELYGRGYPTRGRMSMFGRTSGVVAESVGEAATEGYDEVNPASLVWLANTPRAIRTAARCAISSHSVA